MGNAAVDCLLTLNWGEQAEVGCLDERLEGTRNTRSSRVAGCQEVRDMWRNDAQAISFSYQRLTLTVINERSKVNPDSDLCQFWSLSVGIGSKHHSSPHETWRLTRAWAALRCCDLGAEMSYLGHGEDLIHLWKNDWSDERHLRVRYFPSEFYKGKRSTIKNTALWRGKWENFQTASKWQFPSR